MGRSFYVFNRKDVISLLFGITGYVVQRFAFSEQHFQNVAR